MTGLLAQRRLVKNLSVLGLPIKRINSPARNRWQSDLSAQRDTALPSHMYSLSKAGSIITDGLIIERPRAPIQPSFSS